jgi:hypothetical protein
LRVFLGFWSLKEVISNQYFLKADFRRLIFSRFFKLIDRIFFKTRTNSMVSLLNLAMAFVFCALGFLHIYWGLGGRWGFDAALPQNANGERVLNPGPIECFVVAGGLLSFAALSLSIGGLLNLPVNQGWQCWVMRILVFIFGLRALGDFRYLGFFKTVKGTLFAKMDSSYYAPLCLLLSIMALVLSWRC